MNCSLLIAYYLRLISNLYKTIADNDWADNEVRDNF